VIAYSRPFWPLFVHILGAMTLFGAILAAVIASVAAWRRPDLAVLRRATFWALVSAVPAYVVFRVAAQIIYSDEKDAFGGKDPTWIGIGFAISDAGLLLLLLSLGLAYWWQRAGKPIAGRLVACIASVYLVLLGVAWFAMSAKWG
jgi:hypothetical protein